MEVHDLAGVGIAHPYIMDIVNGPASGKSRQCGPDRVDALGRGIGTQRQFGFQRLDMGIDLDVVAEFLADVPFEFLGDVVGCGERHFAVHFEVDADGELAAEIVHGDMVDGET